MFYAINGDCRGQKMCKVFATLAYVPQAVPSGRRVGHLRRDTTCLSRCSLLLLSRSLLHRSIVIRIHYGLKKTCIPLLLRTILRPDYYVPRSALLFLSLFYSELHRRPHRSCIFNDLVQESVSQFPVHGITLPRKANGGLPTLGQVA